MVQQPAIKTKPGDIQALTNYLRNQVGWVSVADAKKAIQPSYADSRKLDAMKYLGLIERDAGNIKLSDSGRQYVDAKTPKRRLRYWLHC